MEPIPPIKVNVSIGEEKFCRNVNEDLLIDANNLDEGLEKQAALYAYYSVRLQQANCLRDQAEFEYDKLMNEAIKMVREQFVGTGTKTTDKQVMATVETNEAVLKAKQRFINLSYQRDTLYSLVRSLEHKKDALIAIAYRRRSEIDALMSKTISKTRSGIEDC